MNATQTARSLETELTTPDGFPRSCRGDLVRRRSLERGERVSTCCGRLLPKSASSRRFSALG